jgi:hypothetical protein
VLGLNGAAGNDGIADNAYTLDLRLHADDALDALGADGAHELREFGWVEAVAGCDLDGGPLGRVGDGNNYWKTELLAGALAVAGVGLQLSWWNGPDSKAVIGEGFKKASNDIGIGGLQIDYVVGLTWTELDLNAGSETV